MNRSPNITEEILIAYLLGELNEEQISKVEQWLDDYDENKTVFKQLSDIWQITENVNPKPVAVDINKAWGKVEKKLDNNTNIVIIKKYNIIKKYSIAIAASIILCLSIYGLFKTLTKDQIVTVIAHNETVIDTLKDGSIVTLNKNTSITYSENSRYVELKGEAFFEVDYNPEKPFIVDANGGYVMVLGTKFNVDNISDSLYINVIVNAGVVKLYNIDKTLNDTIFVILYADEKGRINTTTGIPEKVESSTDFSNELYWKNQTLRFTSCNISDVINILEKTFDVKIIADESIKSLKLTATFENDNIDQILKIIALTFDLTISETEKNYQLNANKE